MLHTDLTYTHLLSCHLERFTRKNDYLFNFRCPLCGDSTTKKTKMRGYIHRAKKNPQRLVFSCHNCHETMWLGALLKRLAPLLYKEYILETFTDRSRSTHRIAPTTLEGPTTQMRFGTVEPSLYQHAERISDLPEAHYCRVYVQDRMIPEFMWKKLYYSEHYMDFLDEIVPDHGKTIKNDARLVIPFYDAYGALIGVSGRALMDGPQVLRYITVRTIPDATKLIYGLDRVDQSKVVYVTEGPLDSLFLENAVAAGNADLIGVAHQLSAGKIVLVWDNERRNNDIIKQMSAAITQGYSIVIWPEWIVEKDLNAMVLAGRRPLDLQSLIHTHTYSGLKARAQLSRWKKTSLQGAIV
jgi:hypothetical protein